MVTRSGGGGEALRAVWLRPERGARCFLHVQAPAQSAAAAAANGARAGPSGRGPGRSADNHRARAGGCHERVQWIEEAAC